MRLLTALVLLCLGFAAQAQTAGQGKIDLTWVNPTAGCTVGVSPCDNKPLGTANALTAVNVYISTSPIPDSTSMAPTLALGPGVTTTTHTMQVTAGTTLYARIRAINSSGASPFSVQVSKLIEFPVTPNMHPGVTIILTLTP